MIDVFKAEKSISTRQSNRRGVFQRVKALVLLGIILFVTVWQSAHYHPSFQIHSDDFYLTSISKTQNISGYRSVNYDECLVCQLKRQFSNVVVFGAAPNVVFSPEVKSVCAADFFTGEFYRSTESSPIGGRAPPALSLS